MIRKNSNILLMISVLVLTGLSFLAIFLYGKLKEMADDEYGLKSDISNLNNEVKDLKIFENFISDTGNDRKKISSGFVDSNGLVRFIEDAEQVGKNSGVDVNVESASPVINQKDLGPSFHLQASGGFGQVFRYSILLENLPYELAFEKINISKSDIGSWRGDYIIRLLSYEF